MSELGITLPNWVPSPESGSTNGYVGGVEIGIERRHADPPAVAELCNRCFDAEE